MIRYLASRLRDTFRPGPAGAVEDIVMETAAEADTRQQDPIAQDPISLALKVAVREHAAAGETAVQEHALLVQATINDLLARIRPRH